MFPSRIECDLGEAALTCDVLFVSRRIELSESDRGRPAEKGCTINSEPGSQTARKLNKDIA